MDKALLLDRNYMALTLVSWKKVIKLIVKGKAETVVGSRVVKTVQQSEDKFDVPSIIRLLSVVPWKAHSRRLKFSRKNVLIRDRRLCQYCSIYVGKTATIDHVFPKSRGGKTDYLNCVTSCRKCNNYKADRTPDEANIKLLVMPRRPTFMTLYQHFLDGPPKEWKDYIIGL